MSYVTTPPAYFAEMRPDTPYHPGGKGWLHAWVNGWGENPNVAWPNQQAVNGIGDGAPPCTPGPCPTPPAPPFSYVGAHPFSAFFRPGNAPWGRFPQGPAYAIPQPSQCPECVGGAPIAPGVGAYGASCGPCQLDNGAGGCVPCPDGADLPECDGCMNGQAQSSAIPSPVIMAVEAGVITALVTGLLFAVLKATTKLPVGV